jgi:D-aminopeptidase
VIAPAAGRTNSITDVAGVRVGHLTIVRASGRRPVRTGVTAIFTCPPEGGLARPAAFVTSGGRTEVTGLNFVDDFGFLTNPIVATSLRSLGRVYDAMLSRRARPVLGWPPIVIGFDDGRLCDQQHAAITEDDVVTVLNDARGEKVTEGVVGAATGLVAFGYKSGVGSASRSVPIDAAMYAVGALALLNLGRRETLRMPSTVAVREREEAPPALRGSAAIVIVTDAPLDDRQCRRIAEAGLHGIARLGVVPGAREGLVACAVSTGVQLTRNDRSAMEIPVARSCETVLSVIAAAAADAAEEASMRTLTSVKSDQGTAQYPALPTARAPLTQRPIR